jgi:transposase
VATGSPGMQFTVAVTMVAEVGDLSRFDTPRELMTCVGLIPSAYASGERRQQGSMTTAGNTQARRALVEGAWAYRYAAKVSRPLQRRREQPPKVIQDISWKAQVRRCQRDRRLVAKGTHANGVTVASARELVSFMWAMATEVPVTPLGQKTACPLTPHSEGLPTCMGRGVAPVWGHPRRR